MFYEALKINPKYVDAWVGKGGALYYLRRYNEALNCAEQALKINPNYDLAYELKQLCLEALRR